jgi:hypothetical protein
MTNVWWQYTMDVARNKALHTNFKYLEFTLVILLEMGRKTIKKACKC